MSAWLLGSVLLYSLFFGAFVFSMTERYPGIPPWLVLTTALTWPYGIMRAIAIWTFKMLEVRS